MSDDLIGDIREGIAANLATIPDVQVSAYMKSSPTPPTIQVFPDEIEYDEADDADLLNFTVQAFVGNVGDKATQQRLDKMLARWGAYSVKTAIESDTTLGGAAQTLRVTKCTGYQVYQLASVPNAAVMGAQWTVEVYAPVEGA